MTVTHEWRGAFDNVELNELHAEAFERPVLDETEWTGRSSPPAQLGVGRRSGREPPDRLLQANSVASVRAKPDRFGDPGEVRAGDGIRHGAGAERAAVRRLRLGRTEVGG